MNGLGLANTEAVTSIHEVLQKAGEAIELPDQNHIVERDSTSFGSDHPHLPCVGVEKRHAKTAEVESGEESLGVALCLSEHVLRPQR
jgi:hypothetical protein